MKIKIGLPPKMIDDYRLVDITCKHEDHLVKYTLENKAGHRYDVTKQVTGSQYSKKKATDFLKLFIDLEYSLGRKNMSYDEHMIEKLRHLLPTDYKTLLASTVEVNNKNKKLEYRLKKLKKIKDVEGVQDAIDKLEALLVSGNHEHTVEYREFKTGKPPCGYDREIHTYDMNPTKMDILLMSISFRGNDSLYFVSYNTRSKEKVCLCTQASIRKYLLEVNGAYTIVSTYHDKRLLDCIFSEALFSFLPPSRWISTERIQSLTIEELMQIDDRIDVLQFYASPVMAVKHVNESLNALQRAENLKYVFDTRCKLQMVARNKLGAFVRSLKLEDGIEKKSMSKICDEMFFHRKANPLGTFRFNVEDPDICEFLLNTKNEMVYRNDDNVNVNYNFLDRYGVKLSIGRSGLGGVMGIKKGYRTHGRVLYIDYTSFTSYILLLNPDIAPHINLVLYNAVLEAKTGATSESIKDMFKSLLNVTVGNLNLPSSKLYSPDSYYHVVKTGQILILDTIDKVMKMNGVIALLQVCTDGIYVEVEEDFVCDIKLDNPHVCKFYKAMITGNNFGNYMLVTEDEEVILKGEFKHADCSYVKRLLKNRALGKSYEEIEDDNLEEFVIYNRADADRYIDFGGNFNKFRLDRYGMEYLEHYIQDDKAALNYEEYYRLADKLLGVIS